MSVCAMVIASAHKVWVIFGEFSHRRLGAA
jgi:hypothetical protein